MAEMTPADVMAVTRNNGDYGANEWIWIIVLFALFGSGGFGFGNRGYGLENALTRSDLQQGFDNQSVLRKLDGINNGLCDGFYAVNTNNLQMQNQLARDLCQGFSAVNSAIAENRFASQQCCCETNRNIDAVRYEAAKNTCEIVRAIEKDGDSTRALINANTMQALRDKIVEQNQIIQSRDNQLSQQAQSTNLINTLRPTPIPAYMTCSPYMSSYYATNGLNCGCSSCGY